MLKIAIIRTLSLGDSIVAYPLIKCIRNKYPQAHITLIAGGGLSKEYFSRIDELDEVISLKWNGTSIFYKIKVLFSLFKKYDIIFDTIQGSKLTCLMANLFGKKSYGFSDFGYYNHKYKLKVNLNDLVAVQDIKPFIRNIKNKDLELKFPITEKDNRNLLNKVLLPESPYVVIHPSTSLGNISRKVRSDTIIKVINYIINLGYKIIVIGSIQDNEIIDKIPNQNGIYKYHNKGLSIRETGCIISKSKLYIGLNSGPMRISVALKKTSLILHGPSTPSRIPKSKYYPRVYNLIGNYKLCHFPCDDKQCKFNPGGNGVCMNNIKEKDICNIIDKLL